MPIEQQLYKYDGADGVKGASPDVPVEEQQLVKTVLNLFESWKRNRDRYSARWLDYYGLFRGKQWDYRRPRWFSGEIVNMIFMAIQSQAPLQTDARPKFTFLPQEPSDREIAKMLDMVSDADWEKYNWLRVVFEVILDGYLYGTGFSSMQYDQDLEYGIGAPVYKSEDPFYCYPDPNCNDINDSESEGFFFVRPEPTDRLKRKYPKRANLIKPDVNDWLRRERTEIHTAKRVTYRSSDVQLPAISYGNSNQSKPTDKTLVYHCYLKPQDVEQVEEKTTSEDGSEITKYVIKKKYPRGRYLCIANGAVLHDGPLPYDDGLIPYSKYNNYILSREFFGISEVEQLESPQTVFNKILCFSLDCMAMMGNPIWIVDTEANISTEDLVNQPGSVVEKTKGSEVRREMGLGVNPSFFQMLDRLSDWFNQVSGSGEFSRGEAPGGVTAASAIEQLISVSRVRIKQKQRNLDQYLKTCGQQYKNRVFEFYSAPRMFRITNNQGAQQYFKMSIEKTNVDGQQKYAAQIQEYDFSENSMLTPREPRTILINGDFDIRVQTGSDMAFEVADTERKTLALYDRQIIDAEEVLNRLEYPNKEKVLERLRQQQQAAQQQAAAQGGQ